MGFETDGLCSTVILYRYLEKLYKIVHGEEAGSKLIRYTIADPEDGFGLTIKEFEKMIQEGNSLVITVDNGSDSEVVRNGLRGLLVLDHHPSKNMQPYIINPNTGRRDTLTYGTSGGKIVFDFISNIDRTLIKTDLFPGYKEKYRNPRFMMALKGIAAQTLISDMAIWDKNNRSFFTSVREAGAFSESELPFYSKLRGDDSAFSFSFNLISVGNSGSRMKGVFEPKTLKSIDWHENFNLNMIVEWITPSNMEQWMKVDAVLAEVNKKKKEMVRVFLTDYNKNHKQESDRGYAFYFNPKMPHRLSGLIANRISIGQNLMPTLCATTKKNGDIAISARGDNVKDILAYLFDHQEIVDKSKYTPEQFYGGHPNACGGTIKITGKKTTEEAVKLVKDLVEEYSKRHNLKALRKKTEIITNKPVSVSQYKALLEIFKTRSRGAEFSKRLYVPVAGYAYSGISEWASKWQNVGIKDPDTGESVDFLVDGIIFDTQSQIFGSDERILLMELTTNGKASFFGVFKNKQDYLSSVILAEEIRDAVELDEDFILGTEKEQKEYIKAEVKENIELIAPKVIEKMTVEIVKQNPGTIFVFEDSLIKKEAEEGGDLCHLKNTHGIPTRRLPSKTEEAFFGKKEHEQEESQAIAEALDTLHKKHFLKGKQIVFPKNGLGTGIANLKEKKPEFYLFINMIIVEKFGCKEYIPFVKEAKQIVIKHEKDAAIERKANTNNATKQANKATGTVKQ